MSYLKMYKMPILQNLIKYKNSVKSDNIGNMKLTNKEIDAVMRLDSESRYKYAIKRIADNICNVYISHKSGSG